MNAGLLFYLARRTSQCQKTAERYLGYFDLKIDSVKTCARKDDLRAAMSQLVASMPLTVVISDSPLRQPEAAAPLFRILRIPLDSNEEPKGVMRLEGAKHTGYLIESINQAILILPDIPQEILQMLPTACERLNVKFALNGQVPEEPDIDYEELVEKSMNSTS